MTDSFVLNIFGDNIWPNELKLLVVQHLSPLDLMAVRVVCKNWLKSMQNEIFWKIKIPKDLLNSLVDFDGNYLRLFTRGGVHLIQTLKHLKKYPKSGAQYFRSVWYINIAHIDADLGFHYVETNKRFYGRNNAEELKEFMNKARELDCPYLAIPTKYFEDDENFYVVFDNQFEDLQKYIKSIQVGEYNEKLVVKLVRQLIHAIQYLHERNFCLITRFGGTDMGIARTYSGDIRLKLVNYTVNLYASSLVPLCHFMAPESVVGHGSVKTSSDLFSLGSLTLYLLTGSPLYDEHPMRIMFSIAHFKSYEIKDPHNEISDLAKDFVMRLLKRNPEDRLTLEEALNHPWLTNPEPSTSPLKTAYANFTIDDNAESDN